MDKNLERFPAGYISVRHDGTIEYANSIVLKWLEFEKNEIEGRHIDIILTSSSKIFYQMFLFSMIRLHGQIEEIYLSLKTKNNEEIPILLNGICLEKDNGTKVNEFVLFKMTNRHKLEHELLIAKKEAEKANQIKDQAIQRLQEVQQDLQNLNEQLSTMANTDELTGLNNRRSFLGNLDMHITFMTKQSKPLTLFLLDIDYFKKINDTWGHVTGDVVLQKISTILKNSIRNQDLVARYGGEEFAILLPYVNMPEAQHVATRLLQKVRDFSYGDISVTISIGAASLTPGDNPLSLIRRADNALYHSKNEGRDRATFYNDQNFIYM